jgi:CheY-like chemotaxis protein
VSVLVLVVDDEPDVEALFRQQFRRDLRGQRFVMDFAVSASDALARVASNIDQSPILIFSDINMPGMTGLEMLPKMKEMRPDVPVIIYRLRRRRDQTQGNRMWRGGFADQANRLRLAAGRDRHAARTRKLNQPALNLGASTSIKQWRPLWLLARNGPARPV